MRSIFGFNHISQKLSSKQRHLLYSLYYRYHRKMWCYKQAYKKFKRRDLLLTAVTAVVMTGGLAGTAVFLPAVGIGVCGVCLGVVAKKKNYPRKIELTRYAYTSYEKVLHRLRAYLKGESFNDETLIHEMNVLDDNITDLCPPISEVRYDTVFDTDEAKQKLGEIEPLYLEPFDSKNGIV